MPIISEVGAKGWKVRAVYACIYLLLIIGAVTMVYPLALLLSSTTYSVSDSTEITPYPKFWFDSDILFDKYAESKYNVNLFDMKLSWNRQVYSYKVEGVSNATSCVSDHAIELYREWRATPEARAFGVLGHARGGRLLPKNGRDFRSSLIERYKGDIHAYQRECGVLTPSWASVDPPTERVGRFVNTSLLKAYRNIFEEFKAGVPAEDLIFTTPRSRYCQDWIGSKYGNRIEAYNKANGTEFQEFNQIPFSTNAPAEIEALALWEPFVRTRCDLDHLKLSSEAADAWRTFLRSRSASIDTLNKKIGTSFASFDQVPFPSRIVSHPELSVEWSAFLQDSACKVDWICIYGPAEDFAAFCVRKGVGEEELAAMPQFETITLAVDAADCARDRKALIKEFSTRNYKAVLQYISRHGHAIFNTVLLCSIFIGLSLTVQPMAAYALSRFNLPGTYKILLIFMATMAFPGEVSMIPAFMLQKRFPLWPLVAGIGGAIVLFLILEKLFPKVKEWKRTTASFIGGVLLGAVVMPYCLGTDHTYVSLLNTYSAMILPSIAHGYGIFIMKGFFDSMPRELYEAADLDGASEWTKFWSLTINLSKPILAVSALSAFTSMYGSFMWAFITVPKQELWTIMVWVYQLQSISGQGVINASLAIAAIPTFLIFIFCQNIIIRGIVVPTEK